MKERLEVIDFKYRVVIGTFFFFFILSFLAPLTGADYGSFLIGNGGINDSIANAIELYKNGEGRILGRFLINVLCSNKMIFDVLFALLMSNFVYMVSEMLGIVKNKYYYLLPFLGILLVNTLTFSQNYTWIEGSVFNTFPSILSIYYFYYMNKLEIKKSKKNIVLLLLGISIPLLNEVIGIGFLLTNIVYLIYMSLKSKKIKYFNLILTIVSSISLILMLKNTGIFSANEFFSSLNLWDKKIENIPNFIKYLFTRNTFTMLLMLIPINYVVIDVFKSKPYNRLVIVLFNIIPIFTIICNFSLLIPFNLNLVISSYHGIFNTYNSYFIFYWLLFLGLFIYSIFIIINDKKVRNLILLLLFMAVSISVVMLFIPIWYDRYSIIFILVFIFSSVVAIKDLNLNLNFHILKVLLVVVAIYYIISLGIIRYIDYTKQEYIKEQIVTDNEVIEVKANPLHLVFDYNPTTNREEEIFKKYYNIPSNKKIDVKYFGIFEAIEKGVKK